MTQYKIIGGDGKEYGPVSSEQVRQWIAEGRANAQTKVLPEGAADWRTLAEVPEFADVLSAKPAPIAPPPEFKEVASDWVNGPAIGLIVTAILGLVANFGMAVWMVVSSGTASLPAGMPPELKHVLPNLTGIFGVASAMLGGVMSVLVLYGASRMKKLRSYGWAMTATILALVPCTSPCCLVGLPIGIWALVVLMKPEVKAAFH